MTDAQPPSLLDPARAPVPSAAGARPAFDAGYRRFLFGVIAVPRDIGREASRGIEAWISACLLDGPLATGILSVPPANRIDVDRSVVLSIAMFIDDLDDEEGVNSSRAVDLMREVMPALEQYLVREIARKTRGGE